MNKTEKMMELAADISMDVIFECVAREVDEIFNVTAQTELVLDKDELGELRDAIDDQINDTDENDDEYYHTPEEPFFDWVKKCTRIELTKIEAHPEDGDGDDHTEIVVEGKIVNKYYTGGGWDYCDISEEEFLQILSSPTCTGPYSSWADIDEDDDDWSDEDDDDDDGWPDEDEDPPDEGEDE
ncbi:hypothetical protein IKT18_00565 [Candidatus Saccharibacteria bacterium]|nr:hypothetical protein [Candidatus Saccharibacteria bacterium]